MHERTKLCLPKCVQHNPAAYFLQRIAKYAKSPWNFTLVKELFRIYIAALQATKGMQSDSREKTHFKFREKGFFFPLFKSTFGLQSQTKDSFQEIQEIKTIE